MGSLKYLRRSSLAHPNGRKIICICLLQSVSMKASSISGFTIYPSKEAMKVSNKAKFMEDGQGLGFSGNPCNHYQGSLFFFFSSYPLQFLFFFWMVQCFSPALCENSILLKIS